MAVSQSEDSKSFGPTLISWQAPEFLNQEKSLTWKILALIFVLCAVVFGFLTSGWTFSLAILAFSIVYYTFYIAPTPKIIEIQITAQGIMIGLKKIPFSRIKGFWFINEPSGLSLLKLAVKGEIVNQITIQANEQSTEEIRKVLKKKIKELKDQNESLGDIILRNLKI